MSTCYQVHLRSGWACTYHSARDLQTLEKLATLKHRRRYIELASIFVERDSKDCEEKEGNQRTETNQCPWVSLGLNFFIYQSDHSTKSSDKPQNLLMILIKVLWESQRYCWTWTWVVICKLDSASRNRRLVSRGFGNSLHANAQPHQRLPCWLTIRVTHA